MSSPCDTFIAILAAVLAPYDRLRTEGKPGDVAHLSQGLKVFERGQGRSVAVLNPPKVRQRQKAQPVRRGAAFSSASSSSSVTSPAICHVAIFSGRKKS